MPDIQSISPLLAAWENCDPTGPWRTGWKSPPLQRPYDKVRWGCKAGLHASMPPRHTCMPRHCEKLCCHLTLVGANLVETKVMPKALQKKIFSFIGTMKRH